MFSRKEIKKKARWSLKEHLGMWIILCAVAMFLYGEEIFVNSLTITSGIESEETAAEGSGGADDSGSTAASGGSTGSGGRAASLYGSALTTLNGSTSTSLPLGSAATEFSGMSRTITDILWNLSMDDDDRNQEIVNDNLQQSVEKASGNRVLGRSRGVFSDVINRISSGSFVLSLGLTIRSIIGSGSAATVILILLGFAFYFLFWMFVSNTYKVVLARMFLEGRRYDVIHMNRTLFLVRTGSWVNASIVMLQTAIRQLLWNLTIVGGIIKYYSYFLVPYITAENPKISSRDAIRLSRDLMNGHKWECFKLQFSFIGWELLDAFTFGLLKLLFLRPYQECSYCEYYAYLRELGKKSGIANSDLLDDKYLHELPSEAVLNAAYSDVLEALRAEKEALEHADTEELHGLYWFLMTVFGVTIRNRKAEQNYTKLHARAQRLFFEEEAYNRHVYPLRLSTHPETDMLQSVESLSALRSYSIWSIIAIFFLMSIFGWLWEVSLHLMTHGTLVNRGVLHGPWLPIYGTGGALILMVLYRFRRNPLTEFWMIIALCGTVEYLTSLIMEVTMGQRWWDYTGYFLNIQGRICAEGLLVFGVGGMALVYFIAPVIDDQIKKIPQKHLIALCSVLILLFCFDQIYSRKHPNEGEGITTSENIQTGGTRYAKRI